MIDAHGLVGSLLVSTQGAYRMRGIGAGQKIHLFIIPEVKEIMQRELRDAVIPDTIHGEHVLEDVVAWLIVNSLSTEQTQWAMLCIQNMSNLYRKNAFKCLLQKMKTFTEGVRGGSSPSVTEDAAAEGSEVTESTPAAPPVAAVAAIAAADSPPPLQSPQSPKPLLSISIPGPDAQPIHKSASSESLCSAVAQDFIQTLDEDAALLLFDEPIDFSLEAGVPDPLPFEQKLRAMAEENDAFLRDDQHAIADE